MIKKRILKTFSLALLVCLSTGCGTKLPDGSTTTAPGQTTTANNNTTQVVTTATPDDPRLLARYDFSGITEKGTALTTSDALKAKFTAADSKSANIIDSFTDISTVYAGNGSGGGYENTGGLLKFGTGYGDTAVNAKFTLHTSNNYLIDKAIVYIEHWTNATEATLSVGGAAAQSVGVTSGSGKTNHLTFEFTGQHAVKFDFVGRSFIFKIELLGEQSATPLTIPAVDLSITNKDAVAEMEMSDVKNITTQVLPTNASDKTFSWSVSGTSVTINAGEVTAVAFGFSTITVILGTLTDTVDIEVIGDTTGRIAYYNLATKVGGDYVFKVHPYVANDPNPESHTNSSMLADFTAVADTTAGLSNIISAVSINTEAASIYYGNNSTSGPYPNGSGFIKMGASQKAGEFTLTLSEPVNRVVIRAQAWSLTGNFPHDSFKVNDVNYTLETTAEKNVRINFAEPTTSIKISTYTDKYRILIHALDFYNLAA